MSRSSILLSMLAAVVLVVGCGSNPAGSGGGPEEYSLGWGLLLANEVRDSEFPGGLLCMVSCIDVNDEGEPEPYIPWQFYYSDLSDSTMLLVIVQYIGTTNHIWLDTTYVPQGQLPEYDDAGPWVSAARDSLGSGYSDWEEYALLVKGNDYPEFPWVINVGVLQFMSPDTTGQLSVLIDTDDNEVLAVIEE